MIKRLIYALIFLLPLFFYLHQRKKASLPPAPIVQVEPSVSQQAKSEVGVEEEVIPSPIAEVDPFPSTSHIDRFYTRSDERFPIVQTIVYSRKAAWLKGRNGWLSDYAAHHRTSRHFISRSLRGAPHYFDETLREGERFNVLDRDGSFVFYLLVDLSRCQMGFYYLDFVRNEAVFIKRYDVGVGQENPEKISSSLTPLGIFSLGEKISCHEPQPKDKITKAKIETLSLYGTRWIPFEAEIKGCTEAARGFGIHGAPLIYDPENGSYVERNETVGKKSSEGCIRLRKEDVEELFAIIVSRPAFIEIVADAAQAEGLTPPFTLFDSGKKVP